ncbi:fimbria/pilus outer membrane usher protein [Pantoea ananatis]|uniref:fimbria/pilus outer membrane usher protein n=1 Tax=Pantoea ananas TaxID=553 RepID=UPI001FF0DA09|nr:fimbria/pilus outer membrane usher protein [Pantoea ananatis]
MRFALMPTYLLWPCREGHAEAYDALPPPRAVYAGHEEYRLWLTLSVNGRHDESVIPVTVRGSAYLIDAAVLGKHFIRLPAGTRGPVDVSRISQTTVSYDSVRQTLALTVPDDWLPTQRLGRVDAQTDEAVSSPGMLMNYDLYTSHGHSGERYSALWTEQRFFTGLGYLSTTGRVQEGKTGAGQNAAGYLRYDTTWKLSDAGRMLTLQVGDVVSNALSWSNAVRLGGLRLGRSFAVRPDLVTYPMLSWSGTAAVSGSVDLFINGYRSSSNALNAGPWTLTSVPFINGAGEATLVTTDALGRQVQTTLPFYVSNQLLRAGLSDFDFSTGALRQGYGQRSADYGATALSGFYRYGLSDSLTVAVQGEGREGLARAGAGADVSPWRLGTFSLSFSQSQSQRPGQQSSFGYSWYSPRFTLNLSQTRRSAGFTDLSVYNTPASLSRRAEQATLSLAPAGADSGTVGLGYFSVTAHDGTRTRLASLSWGHGLTRNSSIHLTLSKTIGGGGSGQVQVILPLGGGRSATLSGNRPEDGRLSQTAAYSRTLPAGGGVGWNLAASADNNQYRRADMTWRGRDAVVSGGFYKSGSDRRMWADLSGSLVWMDDALFTSSKISDAFIVVSTSGYSGIPVHYENQLAGRTDSNGHLLIPWVSGWYPARLSIDPVSLPASVITPSVEQRIAVREGSGALLNFPVRQTRPLLLTVVDAAHQPLPASTLVTEVNSNQTSEMGFGGEVWFEDVPEVSDIVVSVPGGTCRYVLHLGNRRERFKHGPVVCALSEQKENL